MTNLLSLPTTFLPANCGTRRVVTHVNSHRPFAITTRKRPNDTAETNRKNTSNRNARSIERLARDMKMKSAVKLMQNIAESTEVSFEVKREQLKAKMCEKKQPFYRFPPIDLKLFSSLEVVTAIAKVSRQAATAIDAWTKDHLQSAIACDASIADDLAVVCTWILQEKFPTDTLRMIRLSRLVAVPKFDTSGKEVGVRPICVSSIFAKICGSMAMARQVVKHHQGQAMIGKLQESVHRLRQQYRNDKVIVRIDLANAFNATARAAVRKQLQDKDETLKAYFNMFYVGECDLALYGPSDTSFLAFEDGVRQGDATSAYLFCLVIDNVLSALTQLGVEPHGYMDDLSVVCEPKDIEAVITCVENTASELGLSINRGKSKVLMRQTSEGFEASLTIASNDEQFIVLGANLTDAYAEYNARLMSKQALFFDNLTSMDLHPQLQFSILRICGNPRLKFHLEVNEPCHMMEVAKDFDKRARNALLKILSLETIPDVMLHDKLGAGIPEYAKLANDLYDASIKGNVVLHNTLVTSSISTADVQAQHYAPWMFYGASPLFMSPAQFVLAMCIRLRTLPKGFVQLPMRCGCGVNVYDDAHFIEHALKCNHASAITATHRHNRVRDELAFCARRYGIACVTEPTFYTYDNGHARPDVMFQLLQTPVAIDVTIVETADGAGAAARRAATVKHKIHDAAVARFGHKFYPYAMEIHGLLDDEAVNVREAIAADIASHLRWTFRREFDHAPATALAIGRVMTLQSAVQRAQLV